jgi:transcriptional regulator with XRE-family HTH domain
VIALVHHEFQASQFSGTKRIKPAQPSGLALIESLYFGAGPHAAQDQLQRLMGPEQSVRPYALCDVGEESVGVDIVPTDEISYESFSPPASWNASYSLQRVRLGEKIKSEFVFHPGEEILIPIQGEIIYHFFWSPGARPPERVLLNPPAGEGTLLRINPQIPHHAWATKGEAAAWLILRHATNSPVALVMDQGSSSLTLKHLGDSPRIVRDQESSSMIRTPLRRRVTSQDLHKPGAYAMIAWGISELIRDARQKTGLTTTDLARSIGIDPSSMSRLEEAKANVSIEMLSRVCRTLRIGMAERMESGSWIFERERIDAKRSGGQHVMSAPNGPHFLHPSLLHLGEGERRAVSSDKGTDPGRISSWIVLTGRLLVELQHGTGAKSIILDAGNVLHFREHGNVTLQALRRSSVAQVVHSLICECKPKAAGQSV